MVDIYRQLTQSEAVVADLKQILDKIETVMVKRGMCSCWHYELPEQIDKWIQENIKT